MKNTFFAFFLQKSKDRCWKPNIYELFFGFWTHLGCLVSETQHLRIIFGILDPPGILDPRCGSDPSTSNLDCLQARHVLCLQARHLLCLQPRHLLCRQSWLASWPAWLAGPGWLAGLAGWDGLAGPAGWLAWLARAARGQENWNPGSGKVITSWAAPPDY